MSRFVLGTVACLCLAATARAQTPSPPPPTGAPAYAPPGYDPIGLQPQPSASPAPAPFAEEPVREPPSPRVPVPPAPVIADLKLRLERQIPEWRLVFNNLFVFRYNELGVEDQIRFGIQKRLYSSTKDITRDNFLFFGIYPKINPAYLKVGPSLELQPASIFNLRLAAEFVDFFSTFGYLQSFSSPDADYSPTIRKMNEWELKNYGTTGLHVMIEPTVQMRLGPIAIREKFSAEYWSINLSPGSDVFYDATLDTLVPGNGWVIANDLDVLYIHKFNEPTLVVGLRWSAVQPFYTPDLFASPADASMYNNRNAHERLGPVIAYTFFDRGYLNYNKPTLLLIVNWYLVHPYRTGGDPGTPEALPYILAGFSFQSDLLH